MYYTASKLLWFAAQPSNIILLATVLGTILLWRGQAIWGRRLVTAGSALFILFGLLPAAYWLMLPLDERFPPWRDDGRPVAAIVVLGGAVETRLSQERGVMALNDFAERMIAMGDLARRYPDVPVVFTGGAGSFGNGDVAEADVVRDHISEYGLANGRILFENRSRNTVENARFVRPLLSWKPGDQVILVTSAFHMPRSMGLFRAEGVPVSAYPVDYHTTGLLDVLRLTGSVSDALTRTDIAVREYIGLAAAYLLGHSRELFPAP